ncbi:GGDEF domain-containing protein [Nitrogeniibacter mangrovi]|uniref:diguanylate cyclase n=1 Tax=Nitrogeniibacter mangrovi TaxID=2016596 RepID=A0A6C1B2I3_9RHOO|nr:GGDEF domain-containing protein [Nitrogeniibacter mangrovi]QID17846.1 GGDEF domain-containing protein [Nitrogeniibacter mangrovi]
MDTTKIFLDLLHGAERLSAQREKEDLFRTLGSCVRDALGASSVLLYAVRPAIGGMELHLVGWCVADMDGGSWQDMSSSGHLPADPFLDDAINAKTPWYRTSVGDEDRIAVPVSSGDRVAWLIELRIAKSPSIKVLQGLVALVRTFEHLMAQWEYANLDTLTGLLNRKTFDEQFDRLLALAERNRAWSSERRKPELKQPCWLAIVDIDHFKSINDTYGHLFGDEVLILLAKCMRETFRVEDTLFRFGGEEFVVMLRHVPEDAVVAIFERFRETVETHDFPQVERVTCSIGFACVDDRLTPAELLGRADEALYYAKEHGRNRVCSFDQLVMIGELKIVPRTTAQQDADIFF